MRFIQSAYNNQCCADLSHASTSLLVSNDVSISKREVGEYFEVHKLEHDISSRNECQVSPNEKVYSFNHFASELKNKGTVVSSHN